MAKLLITLFGGLFGIHKFVEGKWKMGFLYLITGGLFGIGWVWDVCQCILALIKQSSENKALLQSSPQYRFNPKMISTNTAAPSDFMQSQSIRQSYDEMEGHEFEYFCAQLLRQNHFEDVEVTKGSGDQGIDILAQKDGIKYGIQCKCYTSDIGNKAVQEAFSGKTFYGCHVAAVLTNRYFTKSARELAESNGVLLWDRDKLNSLISYYDEKGI